MTDLEQKDTVKNIDEKVNLENVQSEFEIAPISEEDTKKNLDVNKEDKNFKRPTIPTNFLSKFVESKTVVSIFLQNGIHLRNLILKSLQPFCIIVTSVENNINYLIYKSSVSSVVPTEKVSKKDLKFNLKPFITESEFLNNIRKSERNITVYLSKGTKLSGKIMQFNEDMIVLRDEAKKMCYLFKENISTITDTDRDL